MKITEAHAVYKIEPDEQTIVQAYGGNYEVSYVKVTINKDGDVSSQVVGRKLNKAIDKYLSKEWELYGDEAEVVASKAIELAEEAWKAATK